MAAMDVEKFLEGHDEAHQGPAAAPGEPVKRPRKPREAKPGARGGV
jgi:hypothetical protein